MLTTGVLGAVLLLQAQCADSRALLHESATVLLEIRIGNIAATTVEARRVCDTALLPSAIVLALAGVPPDGPPASFVTTDSIAVLLHAPIAVDWEELVVNIADDGTLPVSRRVARHAIHAPTHAEVIADLRAPVEIAGAPFPNDAVVDYIVTDASRSTRLRPAIALGIGTNVFRGSLDADWRAADGGHTFTSVAWRRQWTTGTQTRSLIVGNLAATGSPLVRAGIYVSSAPVNQSFSSQSIRLSGAFPPMWEIETIRNDAWVSSDSVGADGRYALNLPLSPGANRVVLSAYGPHEERLVTVKYVYVGTEALPRGSHAFELAAGRCSRAQCNYAATTSARFAIGSFGTLGAALDAAYSVGGLSLDPSLLAATRLGLALNLSARYSRAATRLQFHFTPSERLDLYALYEARELGVSASTARNYFTRSLNTRWLLGSGRSVGASLTVREGAARTGPALSLDSWIPLGNAHFRPVLRISRDPQSGTILPELGGAADVGIPFTRGMTRVRVARGESSSDDLSARVSTFVGSVRVEVGGETVRAGNPTFTISLSGPMFGSRAYGRVATGSDGRPIDRQLSGSIAISKSQEIAIRLAPGAARDVARVSGFVFLDNDGDGQLGPLDEPMPNAVVHIGNASAESDSTGRYELEVAPFARVLLAVDPESVPVGATGTPLSLTPLPNSTVRADIALRLAASAVPSRASVHAVTGGTWLAQDAERGDTPPVHRDNLQPGVPDPHAVAHTWKPAEP